jgi:hypothetical protein
MEVRAMGRSQGTTAARGAGEWFGGEEEERING